MTATTTQPLDLAARERSLSTLETERRDALAGRLSQALLGMMDLLTVQLGKELGLYRALQEAGELTAPDLAARTGLHERYVREWLEQQAVTGILEVAGVDGTPAQRRYALPGGHAAVLLDVDGLSYLAYAGAVTTSLAATLPEVMTAMQTGGGVPWSGFGTAMRVAQGEQNRPIFLHRLGKSWLPQIPEVDRRLRDAPPARVVDVACGVGWSAIAIALAYPQVLVDGFDLDAPSIEAARANASAYGVGERVRFSVRDASDPGLPAGEYDLAVICEALHDLARPVAALAAMRRLTGERGTVLVVDERVAERFTAPGDDLERLFYGYSVLCCLAAGMSERPSAATGAVMRPETLRRYAGAAGFRAVDVLPIEDDAFRLYRLAG